MTNPDDITQRHQLPDWKRDTKPININKMTPDRIILHEDHSTPRDLNDLLQEIAATEDSPFQEFAKAYQRGLSLSANNNPNYHADRFNKLNMMIEDNPGLDGPVAIELLAAIGAEQLRADAARAGVVVEEAKPIVVELKRDDMSYLDARRAMAVVLGNRLQVLQSITNDNLPSYLRDLSPDVQREYLRIQNLVALVDQAADTKSSPVVFSMETYAKEMQGVLSRLNKDTLNVLYQKVPGFRQALEQYVQIYDDTEHFTFSVYDNNGNVARRMNFRDIKDSNGVNFLRESIVTNIIPNIRASELGLKLRQMYPDNVQYEEALRIEARIAEAAASSFLYALNFFEDAAIRWNEISSGVYELDQQSMVAQEFFQKQGLNKEFNPLFHALNEALNGKVFDKAGPMARWIAIQLQKNGVTAKDFDVVRALHTEDKGLWKDKMWRVSVENGKRVLYIPECLPIKFQSGIETTIIDGRSLRDYLSKGDTVPLDTSTDADTFGILYWSLTNYAAKALPFVYGSRPLGMLADQSRSARPDETWIGSGGMPHDINKLKYFNGKLHLVQYAIWANFGFDVNNKVPRISPRVYRGNESYLSFIHRNYRGLFPLITSPKDMYPKSQRPFFNF